jgi:FkbM family methyltransferase
MSFDETFRSYYYLETMKSDNMIIHLRNIPSLGSGGDMMLYESFFIYNEISKYVLKLPQGATVLDAGSHIGLYMLRVIKERPDLKFVCIEPEPFNYGMLVKNIMSNNLYNVVPLQIAISAKDELIQLQNVGNTGAWTAKRPGLSVSGLVECYATTIESIITASGVSHFDYIKMDIEDIELSVLETFTDDIWNSLKGIDLELHNPDSHDVIESIVSKHGFKMSKIPESVNRYDIISDRFVG